MESNNTGILFQPGIDSESTVLKIREKAIELMLSG